MTYMVYFEIFGKKMRTEVEANSEEDAKYKVYGKVVWHKVVKVQDNTFDSIFGAFDNPFK